VFYGNFESIKFFCFETFKWPNANSVIYFLLFGKAISRFGQLN